MEDHILERYPFSPISVGSINPMILLSLSHSQDGSFQGCWHGRPLGRVIHTQNITFTKDPGQNIRGGKLMFIEVDSSLRSSHHSQPAEWKVPGNPTIETPLSHQLPSCKSLFPLVRMQFLIQTIDQVAMVPYRMERGQLVAIAPPSCSAR